MSSPDRHPAALVLGLFMVGSAVTAAAALSVAVKRAAAGREPVPAPIAVKMVAAPDEPIRAEAQVFRTTPAMLAIEPATRRERSAHPRTLKTVRFLRAFPGAPPRIPHALTPEEFRTDACKTCHERGGFSQRFDAYVPVTPHPERGICLQCHAGEDSLMGVAIPIANPNAQVSAVPRSERRPPSGRCLTDLAHDGLATGAADDARPRPSPDSAQSAVQGELPHLPLRPLRRR